MSVGVPVALGVGVAEGVPERVRVVDCDPLCVTLWVAAWLGVPLTLGVADSLPL